ncbi:hypothetical protein FGO68_gene6254 [Halteria grandinella]|uniref:Uncharacterized protein n=1 Tax=Halteria grandinella TaxID=5974 RepID=A0A8J8P7X6_HALGN|nr:hypothetical protein FGO68_gene6254 [Halteria grandinella]
MLYDNLLTSPQSIRWAKTIQQKEYKPFGVTFSQNGSLILVSIERTFVIMRASDGVLYSQYRKEIIEGTHFMESRGLVLTSDADPMAYIFVRGSYQYYLTRFLASQTASLSTSWVLTSSNSSTLGIRLQETSFGRVLIAFAKQGSFLALHMINTTSSTPQIIDSASVSRIDFPQSFSMYSNAEQIAMATDSYYSNLTIYQVKIDSSTKRFTQMKGWGVAINIGIQDLYFDSTESDTFSLLFNNAVSIILS